ncbi:MAG: hypothetical protein ACOX43_06915 [Bacilli bacterium]
MSNKLKLVILVVILFIPILSMSILATNEPTPFFSEVELADEYQKNTLLSIPTVKMFLKGQEYETTAILHHPDGKGTRVDSNVVLDALGQYNLEYKATVANKTYSFTKRFYVYQPKFELTSTDDRAYFSENAIDGLEGVLVSLSQDEKLVINDYFDITTATPEKPIFEASILASNLGTPDFLTLQVRFICKNDPSQYLTVIGNYYSGNDCTYFLAGANNQIPSGYEPYWDKIHVGNEWGAPWKGSFTGIPGNQTLAEDTLRIYFDYETKIVYANYAKGFVVDLDDSKYFGNLWDGFTENEVYVEVTASRYQGVAPAQFLVVRVGDIDLHEQYVYDTEDPVIDIDFGDYSPTTLPVGLVNHPYRIFEAKATDYLSGDCEVDVHVYANYYSSQKNELEIVEGKFIPQTPGKYYIEYSAIDKSGNLGKEILVVNVVESAEDFYLTLHEKETYGKNGELVPLPRIETGGGIGSVDTEIIIKKDGEEVPFENGFFRPLATGTYTVTVSVRDFVEREASESYEIEIIKNEKAVFIDEINLPKYLISGSTYNFVDVYAYDFSEDGEASLVKAVLVTKDQQGVVEHVDGKYTPEVSEHLENVKIYFKATIKGASSISQTYEIPTCVVGTPTNLNIANYFVSDNAMISSTDNSIVFQTTSDAKIDFTNPLLAHGLSFEFDVDANQNAFSKLVVIIQDSINESEVIHINYEKASSTMSYLSVNKGTRYNIPASFFGKGQNAFTFTYDNRQLICGDGSVVRFRVLDNIYGESFTGFSSGKVYISFQFTDVYGSSAIALSKISGQNLSNIKYDLIKPKIALEKEMPFRYKLNDVVTLSPAWAVDVLDPNIYCYYFVKYSDGSFVKDINGEELSHIPIDQARQIKLDKYGTYYVSFYAEDWNNRKETTFGYALEVVDLAPPVLVLTGEPTTSANLGDVIRIPNAKAIDEIDGEREFYVFILCPDGRYVAYGTITEYEMAGKYTIVYYTFDESGNTAKLSFSVDVR